MSTSKLNYTEKFARISPQTLFSKLPVVTREFVKSQSAQYCLTQQELRELCLIANDFVMWKEQGIEHLWPNTSADKKQLFKQLRAIYQAKQSTAKTYVQFSKQDKPKTQKPNLVSVDKVGLGLGYCPVASEKTRCCNLLTLDAVERCGFDCSYCSIQSFYHENEVRFDSNFADKLRNLQLDPDKTYHIGTGQSSDSLMWGNHNGNLEALSEFARSNPNVILEFKTKSKNIAWLLENDYPSNIICTWSLNPQEVIDFEEHKTASLQERINSARKIADKNRLVGFHFHPMILHDGCAENYALIANKLIKDFSSREVAMISMGSLTYTKDVMRTIRAREFKSKILQMPMSKVAGKYSYPDETKIELFSDLYRALKAWHDEVFFYLCMEPAHLWQPVFGQEAYTHNNELEYAMKSSYLAKIAAI